MSSDELIGSRERELPVKCCARCEHSRPVKDPLQLKTLYECKAVPPTPIMMQSAQGIGIKCYFPVMSAESDCDLFTPKIPKEASTN